jgi:hypothetical protein
MSEIILLPPEAKTHLDEKANSLISALKPLFNRPLPKPSKGSMAHKPVTHLKSADIIEPISGGQTIDGFGRFLGFKIHSADIHEFLPEEAAERLEKIAYKVAARHELQSYCDTTYVRDHLVGWIRRRRLEESSDISWTSDLQSSLTNDISDRLIFVPMDGIQIEVPFRLGQISFDYFTEDSINAILRKRPEEDPDFKYYSEKFRKRYQGRVYAKFQCKAEKNYAQKLAFAHTDKALEILKLFNPAAFEIRAQCFLCRFGQVTLPQWHAFHASPEGNVKLLSEGVEFLYCSSYNFLVNREVLNFIQHSGFSIATQFLCKMLLTDLEKRCLEAISHFAHGVASVSPQDRLIHALVAVESLLLGDPNEPIQSNLGNRVALLVDSKLEERIKAKKDFLKGYTLRSRFVHHGTKPDDVETANRVLLLCWTVINAVLILTRKFESKQALLGNLEKELLAP